MGKKKKPKAKPPIHIKWLDACSVDCWIEKGERPVKPLTVKTIGWLYGETKTAIAVAGSRSSNGHLTSIMIIPKVCIVSQEEK